LEPGSVRLISFKNKSFNIEEVRQFKVLSPEDTRPKPNTVVLIRNQNQWLIGKYAWSKQQDTEGDRVFYLVLIRGFGKTQKFEVDENDWESFKPRAMEISS
jgi:hypothetical protein